MFDLKRTADLIVGALTDPRTTWERYLAECPGWQQTVLTLTAPLVVGSVLVGWLLSLVFGTAFWGLGRATVASLLAGLITALLAIALFSFLLSFIAGRMGGKADFDRGVAAVSLTAVPGYAGFALAGLPWLGWLLSLAGAIISLVFLYRIIPLSHAVPENRRVLHFVLTFIAAVVANVIIAAVLGGARMGAGPDAGLSASGSTGLSGRIQEQARLMESMQAHSWNPPADGRVTEQQAESLVSVLERARTLQEEQAAELQRLGQEMEGRELSFRDIRRFGQGVDLAMGLQVAEMRAVDEHDGNWAEHRWVREQLMLAAQGAGADDGAVEHNRGLLERYRERLDGL